MKLEKTAGSSNVRADVSSSPSLTNCGVDHNPGLMPATFIEANASVSSPDGNFAGSGFQRPLANQPASAMKASKLYGDIAANWRIRKLALNSFRIAYQC